eukprot:5906702-Pyramimonas_sp.AAC.3
MSCGHIIAQSAYNTSRVRGALQPILTVSGSGKSLSFRYFFVRSLWMLPGEDPQAPNCARTRISEICNPSRYALQQ